MPQILDGLKLPEPGLYLELGACFPPSGTLSPSGLVRGDVTRSHTAGKERSCPPLPLEDQPVQHKVHESAPVPPQLSPRPPPRRDKRPRSPPGDPPAAPSFQSPSPSPRPRLRLTGRPRAPGVGRPLLGLGQRPPSPTSSFRWSLLKRHLLTALVCRQRVNRAWSHRSLASPCLCASRPRSCIHTVRLPNMLAASPRTQLQPRKTPWRRRFPCQPRSMKTVITLWAQAQP